MRSGATVTRLKPRRTPTGAGGPPDLPAFDAVERGVLEQVVRESADGVLAFDADGRVTLWNPSLERLLGVGAGDALGRAVGDLLPPAAPGEPDDAVRVTLAGGLTAPHERTLPAAARRAARVLEVSYSPLRGAGSVVAGGLATVRDVTARRGGATALAAAERAADRSRRLQALTAALSEAATVEQVADVIVFRGMEAIGADAGSLALLSETDGGAPRFELVRTSGFAADVVSRFRFYPVTPGRPLSDAVLERVPVLLASTHEWAERYADVAYETPFPAFEGFAGVPIVSRGRVIAGVSFSFREAQDFDDGVRTFLATLTEQCAQALERAALFEAERHARAQAERARAEAVAASRAKGEFLATMSHELRTPLNAIAGYSELLLMEVHGPLTGAQRHDLERLQRGQRRLLELVENVLAVANRDAAAGDYAVSELALEPLLAEAEAAVAPRFAARGVEYARATGRAAALFVRADAGKLRQVLVNVLANAAKFTDAGGRATLSVAARPNAVEITVRDSGRGIPAGDEDAIFAPFTQLDRGYTRTVDGTGLGLAIARDLARGMGGDVRVVESEVGVGSTFAVSVPRA
jgi:PAS domain S-box-containing protein